MELSNALRAVRDRAALAAAQQQPALPARQHVYPVHYVLAPQLQQQPCPPAPPAAEAGKVSDDVAQRLQRIEALAEEIAHAQAAGGSAAQKAGQDDQQVMMPSAMLPVMHAC